MATTRKINSFDNNDLEAGPLTPPPPGRFDNPSPISPRGSLNFSLRSPSSIASYADEPYERTKSLRSLNRSPHRSPNTPISKFHENLPAVPSASPTTTPKPTTGNPLPAITPETPTNTAAISSSSSSSTPHPLAQTKNSRSIDVMDYIHNQSQSSLHPQDQDQHHHQQSHDHDHDPDFDASATALLRPTNSKPHAPPSTTTRTKPARPPHPQTFAQRVFEAGKPDLLYDLLQRERFKERTCGVLDLGTLQRMSQHVLQQKLVEQVRVMGVEGRWMEVGVQQTLRAYCDSIRDTELIDQHAARGLAGDPFLITTSDGLQSRLLEDAELAKPRLNPPRASRDQQEEAQRLARAKRETPRRRGLRRLLMALTAALSLVAPMLVMMLVSGLLTKIITAAAFAVGFAVVFAVGSEMEPDKVALVVGVYAGILVVFVSNNPPAY